MAGSPYPPVNPDDTGSLLVAAAETDGRAAAIAQLLPAGAATLVRQMSTEDVAYVVLEGSVELETAGLVRIMNALSVECVRAGVPHRYRALTVARILVVTAPAGVEQLLLHEERLAREDPELLLALAQEHRVRLQL
jgi:quercetin dioxygenase-like cupin family protein